MTLGTLMGEAQGAPPGHGPVFSIPALFRIVLEGWQFWGVGWALLTGV